MDACEVLLPDDSSLEPCRCDFVIAITKPVSGWEIRAAFVFRSCDLANTQVHFRGYTKGRYPARVLAALPTDRGLQKLLI